MNNCEHPKLSIIRSINYNLDKTAQVRDRCRMCGATRTARFVDPENLPQAFLDSWTPPRPHPN